MVKIAGFCQHLEDTEGCKNSLLQACDEGSVSGHCIFQGLRSNWHPCRQLLLNGLSQGASHRQSDSCQMGDLMESCKQVVLIGYPQKIQAVAEVFYQAYYKLIRYKVYKSGITDDGCPSADDVTQEVLLDLHKHFRKGAAVKGSIAAYVARSTINGCSRARKKAAGYSDLSLDQVEIETSSSTAILTSPVIELWKRLDQKLIHLKQGDLINRTIFARRSLEICSIGKKISSKQLMEDWKRLSESSEAYIRDLHRKVVKEVKRFPDKSVVRVAADLINTGQVSPYQLAAVFAAGTGLDFQQTMDLIEQLTSLSGNAIYARICRIYSALASQEEEDL